MKSKYRFNQATNVNLAQWLLATTSNPNDGRSVVQINSIALQLDVSETLPISPLFLGFVVRMTGVLPSDSEFPAIAVDAAEYWRESFFTLNVVDTPPEEPTGVASGIIGVDWWGMQFDGKSVDKPRLVSFDQYIQIKLIGTWESVNGLNWFLELDWDVVKATESDFNSLRWQQGIQQNNGVITPPLI